MENPTRECMFAVVKSVSSLVKSGSSLVKSENRSFGRR
jgi:hypothetical protein